MERKKLVESNTGGRYFAPVPRVDCISTGCGLLNNVLSGGWASGRFGNIVGDRSTGKSLLAIEACANFAIKYEKKALIRYAECEAAFDLGYAESVGLPVDRVDLNQDGCFIDTVEGWHKDLDAFLTKTEKTKSKGGLYILDSLDAIGDDDEKTSEFGKDSYGAKKPKLIGQLFRREVRRIQGLNVTLLIVSQIRDKIGVSFGDKHSRSGGKALDFYASQILWLANKGQVEETRGGVKRKVGMWVGAKCKKNKIGLAHRECDVLIKYSYGIDEYETGVQWLLDNKVKALGIDDKADAGRYLKSLDKMTPEVLAKEKVRFNSAIDSSWAEIERRFLPVRRKYA
jgi:recombination protein RecA